MPSLNFFGYDMPLKKGGKRKKTKVSQKAAQNVNVIVKNIMRNDRTMIYPDMYKKQMDQTQNVGKQNLFSGPPIQYASPPQVIYMPHPNVGKAPVSDLIGTGTNPVSYRRRVGVDTDNINEPMVTPVNPYDIMTQTTPSLRAVPSQREMPAFSITGNQGVTPQLPVNPLKPANLSQGVSPAEEMKADLVSFRGEPSNPSEAGLRSQLFGAVEREVFMRRRGMTRDEDFMSQQQDTQMRRGEAVSVGRKQKKEERERELLSQFSQESYE
jgi:hypothetical protein